MKHGVRPEEKETSSVLGQVRSGHRESSTCRARGMLYRKTPTPSWSLRERPSTSCAQTYRGKASSGAVSSSVGMDHRGDSAELALAGDRPDRRPWGQMDSMVNHAKEFGLHLLGTWLLIRRVIQFSLPNCVLIVHSLQIKRY